jgi:hypothetical protein
MHCLRGKATMLRSTFTRSILVREDDDGAERPSLVLKYHHCRPIAGRVASYDSEKYCSMLEAPDCRALSVLQGLA